VACGNFGREADEYGVFVKMMRKRVLYSCRGEKETLYPYNLTTYVSGWDRPEVKREENSSIIWNEIPSGPKLEASKPVWKAQQQLETALAKVPLTEKKGNECGESKNNSMLNFH
jgi:hypothetical protein